jgi:4-diphosphocytidyl-2-C-methyl-D-erythritol kinase
LAESVARAARAKVNLALHVLGRRPDGYHDIDTLAVFADAADAVAVAPADRLSLSISGPFAGHAPPGAANLALRAAELLRRHAVHPGGAAIALRKNIPAGAGFGGGSADAAATLLALRALWGLALDDGELARLGQTLGADVPMCLAGRALRARGVGERIEPLEGWPSLALVLAWPGLHISTAAVFDRLEERENAPLPDPPSGLSAAAASAWLAALRNDLEAPAATLAPQIAAALRLLGDSPGCRLARMSGSGSGCFGVFAAAAEAHAAAAALVEAQPGWWVQATVAG